MDSDFKDINGNKLEIGDILIYQKWRYFIITHFEPLDMHYPIKVIELGRNTKDGLNLRISELFIRSKLGKLICK